MPIILEKLKIKSEILKNITNLNAKFLSAGYKMYMNTMNDDPKNEKKETMIVINFIVSNLSISSGLLCMYM